MLFCNHEKIAVQIAHGYAKASGKPMMAIVHNVVGLLHAPMGIYYAYIDRSPVLSSAPPVRWMRSSAGRSSRIQPPSPKAMWCADLQMGYQPGSIHGVPDSFARAYSMMMSEPQGPVYMVYDSAMQEAR